MLGLCVFFIKVEPELLSNITSQKPKMGRTYSPCSRRPSVQSNVLTDSHTEVQRIFLAKLKVHCPTAAVHSAIEPLHNKSVESHSASIIHKLPAPLTSLYHTKYTCMTFEQLQQECENVFANSGLGLQQQDAFYLEDYKLSPCCGMNIVKGESQPPSFMLYNVHPLIPHQRHL